MTWRLRHRQGGVGWGARETDPPRPPKELAPFSFPAWSRARVSHDRAFGKERGFNRRLQISSESGDALGWLPLVVLSAAVSSTCQGCGFGLCCACWVAERLLGRATITRWMMPSGWGRSSMASEPLAAAGWVNRDPGLAGSGSDNPLRVGGWVDSDLHGIGEVFHSLTEIIPGTILRM